MVTITRLLKIKSKLKIGGFLQIKSRRILDILWAFLIKQLFHSCLLDIWDDSVANWYPSRTRGIMLDHYQVVEKSLSW